MSIVRSSHNTFVKLVSKVIQFQFATSLTSVEPIFIYSYIHSVLKMFKMMPMLIKC